MTVLMHLHGSSHTEKGHLLYTCAPDIIKCCQDVVTINPSQAVTRKSCVKLCSKRNHRDETETSALHSETKREITAQNVSLSRAEKTHPLLPLQTTWTHGERVSESSTEGHSSIFKPRIFCQEMLLHSCIIYRLTCCTMVHPRLLWDATLI